MSLKLGTWSVRGIGFNRTNEKRNATRHAEIEALEELAKESSEDLHLQDCVAFTTCEPCIMCASALSLVKICTLSVLFCFLYSDLAQVYFGCSNQRFGGCGSVLNVSESGIEGTCGGNKG